MKEKWYEIFAKFLLDICKIVFTTLIVGKIVTPHLVDWFKFGLGIMLVIALIYFSTLALTKRKNSDG